jgi:hypothetical protein
MSIVHHKDLVKQIKDRKKVLSAKSKGPNNTNSADAKSRAAD